RIGAGDPIEAVGDGANSNAAELRIDPIRAKRPVEWHGPQRDLTQIPSCELHGVPFNPAAVPPRRQKDVQLRRYSEAGENASAGSYAGKVANFTQTEGCDINGRVPGVDTLCRRLRKCRTRSKPRVDR